MRRTAIHLVMRGAERLTRKTVIFAFKCFDEEGENAASSRAKYSDGRLAAAAAVAAAAVSVAFNRHLGVVARSELTS